LKHLSKLPIFFLIVLLASAINPAKASPDTLSLYPDANGQQGNWNPTPAERARWDCVDETPPDDSDYITENSGLRMGEYIRIEDSGMSEGTISNVRTVVRMRRLMAFDNDFKEGLWVSWGDMGWGEWHKVSYLAWAYYYVDWALTPQGNAWTWAKVDTVEIMVATNVVQSYMMPQVSQMYIIVTYEEAPAEYNFYGTINSQVTVTSQRSWMFNRYSSINEVFSIQTQKSGSFNLFGTVSQVFSISSLFDYIQTRNFYGSITQIFSAISRRTWVFGPQGLIQQVFGVESYTLYLILGLFSFALSCIALPLSIRKHKEKLPFILSIVAVVFAAGAMATTNLFIAALSFVMAIMAIALLFARRRESEDSSF